MDGEPVRRDLVLRARCATLLPGESVRSAFLVADRPINSPSGLPLTHYFVVCTSEQAVTVFRSSAWWNCWPRSRVLRLPRAPLDAIVEARPGVSPQLRLDRTYWVRRRSLPEFRRAAADLGLGRTPP